MNNRVYRFSVWQPMCDCMTGTFPLSDPFETKQLALEFLKTVQVDSFDSKFVQEIKVYGGVQE